MDANRQSESPARTIDSRGSTTASMDTIVDQSNRDEMMQSAMKNSTNTTNTEQQDSLTNSQTSMIPGDEETDLLSRNHQMQLDAQSHIYSSPVYGVCVTESKTPLPQPPPVTTVITGAVDDKPKVICHEEFRKQLTKTPASNENTLDSRISKKQRLPPELIKFKDGDNANKTALHNMMQNKEEAMYRRTPFPMHIVLGTIQLVLSISLVALGALLIVREASLALAGCGIWTGLIAAVTGSLGVINMRKIQTAFLALSLVCIGASTLALAMSGIGLSRDINKMEEKFDLMNANNKISAACGLIFTLFLHFVVSIISVYRCALKLCTRPTHDSELNDIMTIKNHPSSIVLDQAKVDDYIKTMSLSGKEKENSEKLMAMWMYAARMGSLPPTSMRKITPPPRPIMLIPASSCGKTLLASPTGTATRPSSASLFSAPPSGLLMAAPLPPMPGMQYRGMTLPYIRPGSMLYSHGGGTYQTQRTTKSSEINGQRRRRRNPHQQQRLMPRTGKREASRRQRRKSEADALAEANGKAFTYTGLDRAIADSFLERQEQSNGSHIDYSSSGSELYQATPSAVMTGVTPKTGIQCRDVAM